MKRSFIIVTLIIAGAVAPAAYAALLGTLDDLPPQQNQTEGEIIQAEKASQDNNLKEAFKHYQYAASNGWQPIKDMGTKKKIIDGVNALVDKAEAMGDKYAKKGDKNKANEYYSMISAACYNIVFYGNSDDGRGNIVVKQDKCMKVHNKHVGQ